MSAARRPASASPCALPVSWLRVAQTDFLAELGES